MVSEVTAKTTELLIPAGDLRGLQAKCATYEAALHEIACWESGSFDEPASARVARAALRRAWFFPEPEYPADDVHPG